ncbi:uncharacterized protein LOC126824330 [Patella vulgata]|uniref:uncharacterized protein LOC126824330 n=1 Tax=Patella vulgata TaxID=6465 RepID=UPI002180604E|nr:uncharacterized protein LOC126824330 [Patella vulgata]
MTCVFAYVKPVNEQSLIYFATFCASRLSISYSTIKLYLCGIHFISMENNISYLHSNQLNTASAHLEDHLITVLGRWSSDSYCRYIRLPGTILKNAHRSMASI